MKPLRFAGLLLAGSALCLFVGCGGGAGGGNTENARHLDHLGKMYHSYWDAHTGKGPSKAEDLKEVVTKEDEKAYDALKKGEVVLLYNVRLLDMKPPEGTVLGYAKDTPTKGGSVLMGDATVKDVTADEFKKLPQAKPEGK
jgi:hypothetical protein